MIQREKHSYSEEQHLSVAQLEAQVGNLITDTNPHLTADVTSRQIMGTVVVALLPIVIASGYYFGWRIYGLYLLSIGTAQLAEIIWFKARGRELTFDLSAVVTGLLLTMNLPPSAPWYFPVIGSAFAIIVVKEFFGGLGYNFLNPALGGRAFLVGLFYMEMFQISWPDPPFGRIPPGAVSQATADVTTHATPLAALKAGQALSGDELLDMFLGNTGGRIGETSAVLIIVAAGFLIWRRIIRPHIPLIMVAVVAMGAWLFAEPGSLASGTTVLGHVLGGGLLLGAVFMATDYASSPSTLVGECVYAVGIGVLVVILRFWGPTNEGVSYAILTMNCFVPLIDRLLRRRVLGEPGNHQLNIKIDK